MQTSRGQATTWWVTALRRTTRPRLTVIPGLVGRRTCPHVRTFVSLLGLLLVLACQEKSHKTSDPELAAKQDELAQRALAEKEAELARRREAEEASKRAQEEAKKSEQRKQAAVEHRQACCQVLARRGFEERNEADMAAKKLCLAAGENNQSLSEVMLSIKEALGARALPKECLDAPAP